MVICFTRFGLPLGCTFLEWSFNWLAGHERYWSDRENKWIGLTKNPIKTINAHGHNKNHPSHIPEWIQMSKKFSTLSRNTQPLTFYGYNAAGPLQQKCFDGICHLLAINTKVILLSDSLGKFGVHYRDGNLANNGRKLRDEAIKKEIMSNLFTDPELESKLKSVGEMRDFLTWNMKYCKYNYNEYEDNLAKLSSPNLLLLDQCLLIMDGTTALRNVFKFLKLKIIERRFKAWVKIYEKWQRMMLPELLLHKNMSKIIKCIKNGISHSLISYKLDTFREALIQYHLIKEHGDRLITKKLDRFPKNTKELTVYLKPINLS